MRDFKKGVGWVYGIWCMVYCKFVEVGESAVGRLGAVVK